MLLDFHLLGARTCIGHHLCILKMSAFRLYALSSCRNGRYTFYPLYNKYRAILSGERLFLVLRSVVHLLFWAIKMHCLFCFSKLESNLFPSCVLPRFWNALFNSRAFVRRENLSVFRPTECFQTCDCTSK
jgi:hypothetical protein